MIPIPIVSTVYRATTADTFNLLRTCSQCSRTSPASVSVYSVGEAEALLPVSGTMRGAFATARERALDGLRPAAEHSLALAACPHCKAREPGSERTVRRAAISASILTSRALVPAMLAALAFMLAALLIVVDHLYLDAAIAILVGAGLGVVTWMFARAGTRTRITHARDMADATVRWIGHEPIEPLPVPGPIRAKPVDNGWPFA